MVLDYDEAIRETSSRVEDLYASNGWCFDEFRPYDYVDQGELSDRIYYDKRDEVDEMDDSEIIEYAIDNGLIDEDEVDDVDIDSLKDDVVEDMVEEEDEIEVAEDLTAYGDFEEIDFEQLAIDIMDAYGVGHEIAEDGEAIELENDLYAFKI